MSRNLSKSLDDLISLGVQRVLTSGGETSVLEGLPTLTELIEQVGRMVSCLRSFVSNLPPPLSLSLSLRAPLSHSLSAASFFFIQASERIIVVPGKTVK